MQYSATSGGYGYEPSMMSKMVKFPKIDNERSHIRYTGGGVGLQMERHKGL